MIRVPSNYEPNPPYVSTDYYSEHFHPNELKIVKETIRKSEKLIHRDEIECIYVYGGQGELLINGAVFSFSEGALLLLMPYHIHGFRLREGEVLAIYRITFSIGLLLLTSTNRKVYLQEMKHTYQKLPIMMLNERQKKQVSFSCEEVYWEKQHSSENTDALNLMLISLLVYTVQKNQIIEKEDAKNIRWEILELLQLQHQNQLTLQQIAEQLNLSTKKVQQELRQLTGVGFTENLNRVRMRNAVALMQFEELSINQISKICGYSTEANFYKVFKRFLGVTPLAYRKNGIQQSFVQTRMDAWEIYIYIQRNYKRELQLKTASKELNISEKRINDLLEEAFNQGFKEILLDARLLLAKNLLITLDQTVKEVSQQVGFSDAAAFSRNFKQRYGQTPKQYTLQHKKQRDTCK
nr:helix-turn-helix domain-containing protein [Enterococcus rivorum]